MSQSEGLAVQDYVCMCMKIVLVDVYTFAFRPHIRTYMYYHVLILFSSFHKSYMYFYPYLNDM